MQTPIFNSIFGIKYLVESQECADLTSVSYLNCVSESVRVAETIGDYSLYRFDNALSLGLAADHALAEWEAKECAAPENQSAFYSSAAGSDADSLLYCDEDAAVSGISKGTVLQESDDHRYIMEVGEEDDSRFGASLRIKAKKTGLLYISAEITDDISNFVYVWADKGEEGKRPVYGSLSNSICRAVVYANRDEALTVFVSPGNRKNCTVRVRAFQIDSEVLNRQRGNIVKGGQLLIEEFSDTQFSGQIDVQEENRVLCVTVPYDPGWSITIDGKVLTADDYTLLGDVLYCIPLEKGSHTVQYDYHLPGLLIGGIMSIGAVPLAVVWLLFLRKKWFDMARTPDQSA